MSKSRVTGLLVFLAVAVLALGGCGRSEKTNVEANKAIAVMNPTEGSKVKGFVTFAKEKNGIHVVAQIEGLTPGLHGFHIHEYGDCSSPDAGSAGGHFNPMGMPHAAPTVDKHHMGDLGNIEAPKTGPAKYDKVVDSMAMDGPNSIIGRGVIVHLDADDFKTQPTGGAGARVACGVIGITK
jgi:superoxide dismutase, Cu-Zn family